jgi:hypothetical protein
MPEREKQLGLDANHSHICKFASEEDPIYKQVESNIIHMINKAVTVGQRRPKGQTGSLGSNIASTRGDRNTTTQAGSANESKTEGDDNETNQFGDSNRTDTRGRQNVVMQIDMEPEQALNSVKEIFLRNSGQRLFSGSKSWSPRDLAGIHGD